MLIVDDRTTWTAITQPAHAHLAGQVAALWAEPLGADVVLACEQHDVAWAQWDREPPLNSEAGRAAAFFEAGVHERLALWDHVAARMEAQSPYAAVLVSLHGTNVHTRYGSFEEALVGPLLAGLREEQDTLLDHLPHDRAQAEADADVVFALDQLSLVVCHGWEGRTLPPIRGTTIELARAGVEWTLDPWPLRTARADLTVPCRRLTERFTEEPDLHDALRATPYEAHTVRLRAP